MTASAKNRSRFGRGIACTLGAGVLLAACSSIIPGADEPPPDLYVLSPKSTFSPRLPRIRAQIVVETPAAPASLTTNKIAVMKSPVRLEYYASSEWTDQAPLMVQTLIVESFENSKKIIAVGREGTGLSADYILKPELREFQAVLHGKDSPSVRVRINVKLVRMPDRVIVAGATFERVIPSKDTKIDTIVAAFDEALGKDLKRIVEWTLRQAARDQRRRGRSRF